MVPKVKFGKNVRGAISYNENKVKEGKASLLFAHLYPKDGNELSFREKLECMNKRNQLRKDVETNTVHISLNFHPSEKHSPEFLMELAREYMEGVGYGEQPYLVYQHHDTAHPHLHIVSTLITAGKKRIPTHDFAEKVSRPVADAMEDKHGLVRARDHAQAEQYELKPLAPLLYEQEGTPVKGQISNIVRAVVNEYKFGSLAELNAVLGLNNVVADNGTAGSKLRLQGGLMYSALDVNGNKIGVAIKSSRIYEKPTLKNLESKFKKGKELRSKDMARLLHVIDDVLEKKPDKNEFVKLLKESKVDVVFRTNDDGFLYGITYVDHSTKCVFNGSDFPNKLYSAKRISSLISFNASSPEGQYNQQFAPQVVAGTSFDKGVKKVLAEWSMKGLMVNATGNDDGELVYRLGFRNTSPESFVPVDGKLERYFMVNKVGPGLLNFISDGLEDILGERYFTDIMMELPSSFSGVLEQLIVEAFDVSEYVEGIDFELMKEARKKKRRRRIR